MSPKFHLDKADLISIAKSILLAAAGAALAYIMQFVLPNIDLGKNAWLIPALTVLLNAAQKWVKNSTPTV